MPSRSSAGSSPASRACAQVMGVRCHRSSRRRSCGSTSGYAWCSSTSSRSRQRAERGRERQRGSVEGKINHLVDLRGIGVVGGRKLMHEVFYRAFDNCRQVGSFWLLQFGDDSGN